MEWLNYHHLLYFWVVAKEGSVTRASEQLNLSQPTVSAQLRDLEDVLGQKLFTRVGRSLVLTDAGRLVYRYADEIFPLGKELMDAVRGVPSDRPARLVAGIADTVPALVAHELLKPATELPNKIRLVCHHDKPERLLSELSVHDLDVVISDAPLAGSVKVRAFSHVLGDCPVIVFGSKNLVAKYKRGFPESLDRAPFLFPAEGIALRRSLDQQFAAMKIQPELAGEFDGHALLAAFANDSMGLFAAPAVIQTAIMRQYRVEPLGELPNVRDRYYAISIERKIKHPAVLAIVENARQSLFHHVEAIDPQ
jgi:LysR family transcriptional activator of nhaA